MKTIKLLIIVALSIITMSTKAYSQDGILYATENSFDNYYSIDNWTQIPNSGSIDISQAPDKIIFTSGNSSSSDLTYIEIEIPADGTISFDWSYTTNDADGASFDPPVYLINGVRYNFENINLSTSAAQTGSESITVEKGQVFGLGIYTTDGLFGSATVEAFTFSGPVVPINILAIIGGFSLIGVATITRKKYRKKIV